MTSSITPVMIPVTDSTPPRTRGPMARPNQVTVEALRAADGGGLR
jgi:hypothetical protein